MTLALYLSIQYIVMGAILALALQLIFVYVPHELKGSRIHHASQVAGLSLTIMPIAVFVFSFSEIREVGDQYATATNLTVYCLVSTLLSMSYYILLDHIAEKPIIKTHIIIGLAYPIPLWIGICYGSQSVIKHTLIAAYTIFCIIASIHISTCIHLYKEKLKEQNRSKQKSLELKLTGKTIYASVGLMIISICSPFSNSYPTWLSMIYVVLFIAGIVFIYISYLKILRSSIKSLTTKENNPDKESYPTTLNVQVKVNIERHLQNWLNQKEYLDPHVSINSLTKATYTNRTYLSKYINTVYHCSFKTWVTQLRIEQAKELMQKHKELS